MSAATMLGEMGRTAAPHSPDGGDGEADGRARRSARLSGEVRRRSSPPPVDSQLEEQRASASARRSYERRSRGADGDGTTRASAEARGAPSRTPMGSEHAYDRATSDTSSLRRSWARRRRAAALAGGAVEVLMAWACALVRAHRRRARVRRALRAPLRQAAEAKPGGARASARITQLRVSYETRPTRERLWRPALSSAPPSTAACDAGVAAPAQIHPHDAPKMHTARAPSVEASREPPTLEESPRSRSSAGWRRRRATARSRCRRPPPPACRARRG